METHPPRRKFVNPSHWRIFVCVGSFTSLIKFLCTLLLRTLLLVVLTNYVHQYKEWLGLKFLENILLACKGICFDFRFVLTSWCFKNEKWEPQMKKLRKSVTVKQIANKILYKTTTSSVTLLYYLKNTFSLCCNYISGRNIWKKMHFSHVGSHNFSLPKFILLMTSNIEIRL